QSEIVFASITPPAPTTFAFKCSPPTAARCLSASGVSWLPLCFKQTYGSSPTDRDSCQCSKDVWSDIDSNGCFPSTRKDASKKGCPCERQIANDQPPSVDQSSGDRCVNPSASGRSNRRRRAFPQRSQSQRSADLLRLCASVFRTCHKPTVRLLGFQVSGFAVLRPSGLTVL